MSEKCNQQNCDRDGSYRFTWPGRDEAHICEDHVKQLRGIAAAMGFPLQVIPVEVKPKEGDHD